MPPSLMRPGFAFVIVFAIACSYQRELASGTVSLPPPSSVAPAPAPLPLVALQNGKNLTAAANHSSVAYASTRETLITQVPNSTNANGLTTYSVGLAGNATSSAAWPKLKENPSEGVASRLLLRFADLGAFLPGAAAVQSATLQLAFVNSGTQNASVSLCYLAKDWGTAPTPAANA